MVNRLSDATSPYLLQHADNPVDWWEWGPGAFAEARERDVPVLLSVGYASCHWCHVMAHESFEDPATAETMNGWFVNIKVDREERPDVDRIYMDAVQALSGHGGWPMTVFLTPDAQPFYAGTYYPKHDRPGHASFGRVLDAVHDAWINKRSEVEQQAGALADAVAVEVPAGESVPDESVVVAGYRGISAIFDRHNGGFGGAPKFPQAPTLELVMRAVGEHWAPDAREILTTSLTAMADGGIHDQVAGGFSRYSVDDRWLVPHFEKMLYDNALLARLYGRAWQVTGEARFLDVARSTLDYMVRDLELPGGGFASGEDADSEGEEGKFYVFSWNEFVQAGGTDAIGAVLGVAPEGNVEGTNIVHRSRDVGEVAVDHGLEQADLERDVAAVLEALGQIRSSRVRPGLDDKAVCAWNALAVRAFAEIGSIIPEPEYLEVAERTARFVLAEMRRGDGRLLRAWRDGRISGPAFCDDYGALAVALFALYQATGDATWFREGMEVTSELLDLFWDGSGGFFATGRDADDLIARPKNLFDNPVPSDNALAAEALQHAAAFTGDPTLLDHLEATLRGASLMLERYPHGAGHMLSVLLVHHTPPAELAIVGAPDARLPLERAAREVHHPHVFLALGDGKSDAGIPLLEGRTADGAATAYLCRGFVCEAPLTSPEALAAALQSSRAGLTPAQTE